jgi:hypothetical protein
MDPNLTVPNIANFPTLIPTSPSPQLSSTFQIALALLIIFIGFIVIYLLYKNNKQERIIQILTREVQNSVTHDGVVELFDYYSNNPSFHVPMMKKMKSIIDTRLNDFDSYMQNRFKSVDNKDGNTNNNNNINNNNNKDGNTNTNNNNNGKNDDDDDDDDDATDDDGPPPLEYSSGNLVEQDLINNNFNVNPNLSSQPIQISGVPLMAFGSSSVASSSSSSTSSSPLSILFSLLPMLTSAISGSGDGNGDGGGSGMTEIITNVLLSQSSSNQ